MKAVLDEVFGEENFQNEIIWKRTPFAGSSKSRAEKFPINHDSLFFYSKSDRYVFERQFVPYSQAYVRRFKNPDNDPRGPWQSVSLKTYSDDTFERIKAEKKLIPPRRKGAGWRYKWFLSDTSGKLIEDIWSDVNIDNPMSAKRADLNYPTLKPEELLERIIVPPQERMTSCWTASSAAARPRRWQRNWAGAG